MEDVAVWNGDIESMTVWGGGMEGIAVEWGHSMEWRCGGCVCSSMEWGCEVH